jgi:hypothetical protein
MTPKMSSYKGGIPGTWRQYPTPEDWYDLTQRDRFKDVEIDLTGDAPSGGGFITLPGSDEPERLKWRTPQGPVQVDDNGLRTLPVSSPRLVPNRVLQLAQAHVARPTLTPFKVPPCKATAHEHATVPNRTSHFAHVLETGRLFGRRHELPQLWKVLPEVEGSFQGSSMFHPEATSLRKSQTRREGTGTRAKALLKSATRHN